MHDDVGVLISGQFIMGTYLYIVISKLSNKRLTLRKKSPGDEIELFLDGYSIYYKMVSF